MAKANPFRFSTKYQDGEADLLYYGHRYYSASTGRWLSRDPIGELGGANLCGFVRNDPIQLVDRFGLDWKVFRAHGQLADAICDCGDTWDALARKLNMDTSDYQKWVHTTDAEPVPGKVYNIPNTIIFEYGEANIWTGIIDVWRSIARRDHARLEGNGYNVIVVDPTSSAQMTAHMRSPGLYGMVYIGHGDEDGGGVLDLSSLDYLKPGRYTAYGIAFLDLKACNSADTVTPKEGWRFNMWEFNVAERGWFTGYEGGVNIFNEIFQWRATRGKKPVLILLKKPRRFLCAGLILFTALVTAGIFLLHGTHSMHRQRRQEARREAYVRADRLALYSSIGFLEEDRRQNVSALIGVSKRTNVNAALVHLLAESHMSFPVPVSNFAGSDMFVDPWGLPYQFIIATNAEAPVKFGRHIERRIRIERGPPP